MRTLVLAVLAAGLLAGGCAGPGAPRPPAAEQAAPLAPEIATGRSEKRLVRARLDMVAAADPRAVDAGVAVLARGGSAVDAAIAVQMVLNVVEPQSSGVGGGGFLLHHDGASGRLAAYDGRETAPARIAAEPFRGADGRPLPFLERVDSGLSVGVPGLLRMLELAHARHGRLPWATLFEPAIRLADEGFEISPRLHRSIAAAAARICPHPAPAALLLAPGGCEAKPAGTRLRNPQLAASLRRIAAQGADALYTGPMAEAIAATVRSHPQRPGTLSPADLAGYRAREREPVCGRYRAWRICGMPPPSSGGIAVLQTLAMLERFALREHAPDSLAAVHLVSEAQRLAYADRERYAADPDFVAVPVAGLLDPAYLAARSALLRSDASLDRPEAGTPAGAPRVGRERAPAGPPSTTHVSIVDREGNAVAMTTSIEHAFGSLLMAGGFLLNNQLTDFAAAAADADGVPLANRAEPGKRPRSAMSPTLVLDADGRLVAALGSPGGSAIIQYVSRTLLGLLEWRLDVQQAIDLPNYGGLASPVTLLERGTRLEGLADGLRALGHRVVITDMNSGLHGVARDLRADGDAATGGNGGVGAGTRGPGGWTGGADPRREGTARGNDR